MACLSVGPISRIDPVDVLDIGGTLPQKTISRAKFCCRFVSRTRFVSTCSISILASILRSCPTLPDPGGFLFLCGRTRQYEARLDDPETTARYPNNGDSYLPHPSYTDRFPLLVPNFQSLPVAYEPGHSNKGFPPFIATSYRINSRPLVSLFEDPVHALSGLPSKANHRRVDPDTAMADSTDPRAFPPTFIRSRRELGFRFPDPIPVSTEHASKMIPILDIGRSCHHPRISPTQSSIPEIAQKHPYPRSLASCPNVTHGMWHGLPGWRP